MQPSKYRQLFKELRQQILDAVFTAGNPFPSESALAREKGLTRNTVHRAYLELRRQGLVEGNPGEPPRLTRRAVRRKIGLVVRGTSYSEFFQPIVGEISMLAQRKGYSILFGNTAADNPVRLARDAMALAQNLVDCGASGVILQPFEFVRNSTELNAAMLAVFAAAEVPVVLIDYDAVQPPGRTACDLVGINNFQAGWRLADHLLAAGARQIDFVLRPDCAWSVHGRLDGVRAAVARAGMPPCAFCPPHRTTPRRCAGISGKAGLTPLSAETTRWPRKSSRLWRTRGSRFRTTFCWPDSTTCRLPRCLRRHSLPFTSPAGKSGRKPFLCFFAG